VKPEAARAGKKAARRLCGRGHYSTAPSLGPCEFLIAQQRYCGILEAGHRSV